MGKLTFRKLKAEEIELRVGATNDTGFQLLLYKDARVDMNLLDEVVGQENWQRKHYMLGNDIYCSVGIYYEDKGWVWKDDAGSSGTIEVEKSKASDSFKRACVNATGVGRELYTAPFVWIKKDQDNDPKKSHYIVSEIEYSNGEISKLVIMNEKTKQVVFSCGSQYKVSKNADLVGKKTNAALKTNSDEPIREEDKKFIDSYINKLTMEQYESFFNWLNEKFGVRNIGKLNAEQGVMAATLLKGRVHNERK